MEEAKSGNQKWKPIAQKEKQTSRTIALTSHPNHPTTKMLTKGTK